MESTNRIGRLLEDARKRLVETGSRNRLVHVSRTNRRANALNIINERSEDIFELLRTNRKKMRFKATVEDDSEIEDAITLAVMDDEVVADYRRFRDSYLETPLGPEALQRRLLRLFSDAKTAEEEQGVNILYLALGFLKWYEDKSSGKLRESPLILLPVELIRNERGSTFSIRCREEDIETNLPLQERLLSDFGIKLPDIDDAEEWSPEEYYKLVDEVISDHPRWEVEPNGMLLGFFSFAKLLMLRDLDPSNWPEGVLVENENVQNLLFGSFETDAPLFGKSENLDEKLDPKDIVQVVDADASQTRVIEEVRSGRNLVVQGPPGTGKSQTISNIISAAVHDGKTVLFVAEKMAALNVVHNRLKNVNLSEICLELHSRNANKKAVIQELQRTLALVSSVSNVPEMPNKLRELRNKLNDIADCLHQNLPGFDYSPFSILAEISDFIGRETVPPELVNSDFHKISNLQRKELVNKIEQFVETLKKAGPRRNHPFHGVGATELQPVDLQRLENELRACIDVLKELLAKVNEVSTSLLCSPPESIEEIKGFNSLLEFSGKYPSHAEAILSALYENLADSALGEAIENGKMWRDSLTEHGDKFQPAAWTVQIDEIRSKISKGAVSFLSRLFGGYRGASREFAMLLSVSLPKSPQSRLALVDKLIEIRSMRRKLERDEPMLKTVFGTEWRGENSDFNKIVQSRDWIENVNRINGELNLESVRILGSFPEGDEIRQSIQKLMESATEYIQAAVARLNLNVEWLKSIESANIENLVNKFSNMLSSMGQFPEWQDLNRYAEILDSKDSGLESLREALEEGKIDPECAVDEFCYAVAEDRWKNARKLRPELEEISRQDRHLLVKEFCEIEKARFQDIQTLIKLKHRENVPTGSVGEMGFIRGEIGKKKRHKPIRKIVSATTEVLQRIKPVFLMSPISVAQFLPPNTLRFDLLVIDEASQVRPEDALGAAIRANQLVIVGDKCQLPPTSFFDRITDDDHDDDADLEEETETKPAAAKATEMESILTLCEARGIRSNMLEWHYRSKDPSLIRVSNDEFYEARLKLPPSPVQRHDDYGLKFTQVPGVYSSRNRGGGRPGTNRIEAEHIVEVLADHARNWSDHSVGVVAFSKAQSSMITEVLEVKRREDSVLDSFLRGSKNEDVFVKNIENVQGDERDVILISVGYGPNAPNEQLRYMNFGPVNSEGGERRLNVLFSRARIRCEVFASFKPGDIDLSRAKGEGPRVLKRFLNFAHSGKIDEKSPTGDLADSPFEEDVARIIESLGYLVDHQVGSAGFRIDIGVRHRDKPGVYILAVECDGATWHSALWARERDRQRQEVLENLGWKFHRIWSTDWFHRRKEEIDRLRTALEKAKIASELGIEIHGSNRNILKAEPTGDDDPPPLEPAVPIPTIKVPSYEKAILQVYSRREPHEISIHEMAKLASEVVSTEGPVHVDIVTRRIASAFGKSRAGNRIQTAVKQGLKVEANVNTNLHNQGEFWFTSEQENNPPIRDRSHEESYLLKAEYFSPMEIRAAQKMILDESGKVEIEELVREISKLFGFQRTGPELQHVISNAISQPD